MSLKFSLSLLLALLVAGCAAPVTTPPPAASTSTVPAITPTASVSDQDALALVNQFYDRFITQHNYSTAEQLFDDQMKAALPESKLKEVWDALSKQVGTLQTRSDAKLAARKDKYQQVIIPLQFEKAPLNMLVVVDVTTGKISGLFFQPNQEAQSSQYQSPTYVDPNKFAEQDVKFGPDQSKLPGTLTLPKGTGPFPAVVLVHGSGPNDRDETIGPNKPFKDIAQGLASQGIAVLRYDKRTKVYPQDVATIKNFTVKDETIDDAAAAVDFLRQQAQIDPKRVFVLGHSLGGYLAPRIAQANPNIAGLIILAGAARPLEDLMLEQTRYILQTDGSLSADDQTKIDQVQQEVDQVKALTAQSPLTETVLGAPASYWLDLKDYHPADVASALTLPMFVAQGERDYQVTLEDFNLWKNALAGHTNVQFKTYPDLNHLFITGTGQSTPAEYEQPGNVSAAVIQDIAAWIQQQK